MAKELNLLQAMEMPLGTELTIKYEDGYTRKVALVESNEVGNNSILLKYLDLEGTEAHYVDVHRELVKAKSIPIQKPVSFMEAVKSGKRIKAVHKDIADYGYYRLDNWLSTISENYSEKIVREVILNGQWYIEEE